MAIKISAREILTESKMKSKLKECFAKCAQGRQELRVCVSNSMDAGLSKEEILAIINKRITGVSEDDSSLCSVVAIGQMMRYEDKHVINKSLKLSNEEKKESKIKLEECL